MSDKINVDHVAKLARLGLNEEDKKKFGEQLSSILNYVEKLNELKTDNVSPTAHVFKKENVLREDIVKPFKDTDKILNNAPDKEDRFFKVKKIIE
jgi:aspartyl-tRNA(Asn)/glutamyl-tRNA(Gln) amidotransferase subunit C